MKFDIGCCPSFAFITVISPFRQLIDRWSQCVQDQLSPAHVLASQLLKFCDHAVCYNAPHTD